MGPKVDKSSDPAYILNPISGRYVLRCNKAGQGVLRAIPYVNFIKEHGLQKEACKEFSDYICLYMNYFKYPELKDVVDSAIVLENMLDSDSVYCKQTKDVNLGPVWESKEYQDREYRIKTYNIVAKNLLSKNRNFLYCLDLSKIGGNHYSIKKMVTEPKAESKE